MEITRPHAALLASPGMGHLIPVLELGKRLAVHHGFLVTVFVLAKDASNARKQLQESSDLDTLLDLVPLPHVDIAGKVDPAGHIVTILSTMVRESLPGLRSAISGMESRPTVFIADLFCTEALAVAGEFSMGKYVFIASNAKFLALIVYFPTIGEKEEDEHIKEGKPLEIPGCKPVRFKDTLSSYLDRSNQAYKEFTRLGRETVSADGVLVNTFNGLEPDTLGSFDNYKKLGRVVDIPVYPVGPIVRPVGESSVVSHPVLDWLDDQPTESVIYVSFGSGGMLSAKQITELAWGLELSQQRFIWVVRPPLETDSSQMYLTAGTDSDGTPNYLPEGFMSRTAGRGMVVSMWAPQAMILSHPSLGGFLTHCGWNSTMESLLNGVPMIVWPLYADQKMNAAMLTEELGVAVRPEKSETSGIVERKEIEAVVRKIMVDEEGYEIRKKAKEVKQSAHKALRKGGSSYTSMSQFARDCEISLKSRAQGA